MIRITAKVVVVTNSTPPNNLVNFVDILIYFVDRETYKHTDKHTKLKHNPPTLAEVRHISPQVWQFCLFQVRAQHGQYSAATKRMRIKLTSVIRTLKNIAVSSARYLMREIICLCMCKIEKKTYWWGITYFVKLNRKPAQSQKFLYICEFLHQRN